MYHTWFYTNRETNCFILFWSHETQVRKRLAFEEIHLNAVKRPIIIPRLGRGLPPGGQKSLDSPRREGGGAKNFGCVVRGGGENLDI